MNSIEKQTDRPGKWLPILVAILAFLAFLPALHARFVNWDDEATFLTNTAYRGLGWTEIQWMLTTTWLGHWSPLVWLTWSLNYVVGGLDPWGYHLGNLLLHSVNVALVWLIARRLLAIRSEMSLTGATTIAAGATFAALVWGVHPLRAEAVAWASARRDLLCGLFYLLAVLGYLRGVAGRADIERRWWGLSLLAFGAALASKSIALTLPLSLLLMDCYPLRRRGLGWRALGREKLPYVALATAAGIVALMARQETGNITGYAQYGVGARLLLGAYSWWFSLWKFLWPAGLSPMYELPTSVGLGQPRFLVPALGVLAVTATLVLLRRRWPAGLAAWAHSLIVLTPIAGVVHSGNQLTADRYSYLSSLGFAVLAGAGLVWALEHGRGRARRWTRPTAWATAALVVVALGAAARTQTAVWADSETLWRRAVAVDPGCSLCESNLGRVVAGPGRFAEAETHVHRAITLRPDRPGPHENMGSIMLAQGRDGEAEQHFRRAATVEPDRAASRNALGVALARQGRDREAEVEFKEAFRLSPRLVDAPANLGVLYAREGRLEEAIGVLRQALALDGRRPGVRAELGRALRSRSIELVREGRLGEAEQLWREAAPLVADDPDTLRRLGQALVEQGKGVEAIPILERAVAVTPRGGAERFWLARAYRLTGRRAEAEREIAALRELAPAYAAELSR